jgi:polyferredoxin
MGRIYMTVTVARPRRRKVNWTNRVRRTVQLAMAGFIFFAAARHQLGESAGVPTSSLDALCPFGAVETLVTWITTGQLITKVHPSNLILGLGLLIGVILTGNAFCGWLCPFGAYQDLLHWVKTKLHLPEIKVGERTDTILRYGRFVTLGIIIYASATTLKLWFADYDPFRTLFSLHWLFAPNLATMWPAFVIVGVITIGSLLIQRFWCRYLCPLGGLFAIFNHLSILRIRRTESSCKGCALCEKPCPVGIKVAEANPAVNTNCIGCLECVDTCPRHGALTVQIGPTWYDAIKKLGKRHTPEPQPVLEQAGPSAE